MQKINYKSDFDLIATIKAFDTNGNEIDVGFMDYDWEIDLYTGCNNYASRIYKVSYINNKATNCFDDNGKIHIVCDNHQFGKGALNGTAKVYIPNEIYPDGTQLIVTPINFAIELVADGGDYDAIADASIVIPVVYSGGSIDTSHLLSKVDAEKTYAKKTDLPTKLSQLANDAKFITLEDIPEQEDVDLSAYLTKEEADKDFAKKTDIPSVPNKVSELENDAKYITLEDVPKVELPDNLATTDMLVSYQPKGDYALRSEIPTMPYVPTNVSELNNDADYATANEVATAIANAITNTLNKEV